MKIIGSWILLLFAPLLLPEVSAGASSDEIRTLDESDADIVTDAAGLQNAINGASDDKANPTPIRVSVNATITLNTHISIPGTKYFHALCIGYDETNKCTVRSSNRNTRLFKITQSSNHLVGFSFTGFEFREGRASSSGEDDEGGGAFYITKRVDATFTDCSFANNRARSSFGGALYVYKGGRGSFSNLHFTRCTFSENTANDGGGAIFAKWSVRLFIAESRFLDNDGDRNGNDILGVQPRVALTCTATTTSGTAYDLNGVSQSCSATDVPSSTPSLSPSSAPSISSAPSSAPSNAPTTPWEVITFDDFAWSSGSRGWGNFRKRNGSGYATRIGNNAPNVDHKFLPNDSPALRIRNGDGKQSAVWHKQDHNVMDYTNLRVSFSFKARGMENGHFFVLEYSSDGGSSWDVMKKFVIGDGEDFQNGSGEEDDDAYEEMVDFNAEDKAYETDTSQARIRFRCEGDHDSDYIYIDDVSFEGCVGDC